MKNIKKVHDLSFQPYITANDIAAKIKELGATLKEKYADKRPILLGILNGSFVFMADVIRACDFECELAFVRLSSYENTTSTGKVREVLGMNFEVKDRHIILLEDIIDSGNTLHHFLPRLQSLEPASISITTLLLKPEMLKHELQIDHVCFEIPPKFVIGYGLDYNELGRNLPDIYQLCTEE